MRGALDETVVIFAGELRRIVSRRGFLIVAASVPAILLLLTAVVPAIRAIVDDDDEDDPDIMGVVMIADGLPLATDAVPDVTAFETRESGIDVLAAGDLIELFVVSSDYLASGEVEWLHKGGGANPGGTSSETIKALLRLALAADDLSPGALALAMSPPTFGRTRLAAAGSPIDEDEDEALGKVIVSLAATGFLIFAIIIGASGLLRSVAEEKENRMIEVLLTSAKPLSVMTAKVLAFGVSGFGIVMAWIAALLIIAPLILTTFDDAPILSANPVTFVWVGAFFVAGYFFSAAILAAVGAATDSVKEADQLSMIVILPQLLTLEAIPLFFNDPSGPAPTTLSLIPFTAPTASTMRLAIGEPSRVELLSRLAITLLFGVALLWAAGRLFRAEMLMYGQRMGIRKIVATLREAG